MKKLKHVIGIDVSKDSLAVCFGSISEKQKTTYVKHTQFSNNRKGFEGLLEWASSLQDKESSICFVMEATGVYYENLAHFLSDHSQPVHVLLPNKTKHFAKSLDIKSKTDEIDAKMLAQIALERELDKWQPHSSVMHTMKQLSREYRDLKKKLTALKNQLHAKEVSYNCPKQIIKRMNAQIKLMEAQSLQVESEMRELCAENDELAEKIAKIETVPGLSFMTIITIVSESNGFVMFENSKQLVSYSGYDVMHNASGNFKGKSKISKRGNRYIRAALYMPALCAIQHNPILKDFYDQLVERKKIKKVGVTAVARKMLALTYTLWKNNTEFDLNYKKVA
jgi:transposase